MSDNVPLPLQSGVPQLPNLQAGHQPLPVWSASQLALAMTINEISITFGRTRQMLDPTTGAPADNAALEWLFTVSLGPSATCILRDALIEVVKVYEERFGKIPTDPSIEMSRKN